MNIKRIISAFSAAIAAVSLSFSAFAESSPIVPEEQLTELSAKSAIVINAQTGTVLFEKNAYEKRAMASTTKIMTALLTLEAGELDRKFVVDSMAIRVEGTSMGLKEGDIVTRRALCYGMLLPSGNDAANAAAVNIAGSISAFAELMNKRAQQIGMKDTSFVTPSGLDADGHETTAYDMALLTMEALKNDDFREICSLSYAKVEFGDPITPHGMRNSNKLLAMYEGCIGVKTGFTDNARRCLVSAAERDGCTVIAVTLNAPNDWEDHRKLLDMGFSKLNAYDIKINSYALEAVGGERETVTVSPERKVILGLTPEESAALTVKYRLPRFAYADIEKGEKLGRADIYIGGRLVASCDMTAAESCLRSEKGTGFVWGLFG